MTDIPALVAELREIHARSRENAVALGWGVPDELLDESPWSRAADALVAQEAELKERIIASGHLVDAAQDAERDRLMALDDRYEAERRAERAEAKITAAPTPEYREELASIICWTKLAHIDDWNDLTVIDSEAIADAIHAAGWRRVRALSDTSPTNQQIRDGSES